MGFSIEFQVARSFRRSTESFKENGMRSALTITLILVAASSCTQDVFAGVVVETITVGNVGNAGQWSGISYGVEINDFDSGAGANRLCGAVDYTYEMGKYEVTAGQYTEFLNAVAATDSYGLFNTTMASLAQYQEGCNIQRSGSSGNYSYSVDSNWADYPVNYISWSDAARFANWMHNGQPTGQQDLNTTEDGSYLLNGATSHDDLKDVTRKSGATWVLPSEDEWYKAAYHKNDGDTGNYFGFPTSSDELPGNEVDGGVNSATYFDYVGNDYTVSGAPWRTEVGAHINTQSPYGAFDMAGNVAEWTDTIQQSGQYTGRNVRGGQWEFHDYEGPLEMHSAYRFIGDSGDYSGTTNFYGKERGFRLAFVPEPTTFVLLSLGGLLATRRRLCN